MAEVSSLISLPTTLRHKPVAYLAAVWLLLFIGFTVYEIQLARGSRLQVMVEMYSAVNSQAQLFWDTKGTFDEHESSAKIVRANWSRSFDQLVYLLPRADINRLRFDPIATAGRFSIRLVEIRGLHQVLLRIPQSNIAAANQIASRTERGNEVSFVTSPGANDPQLAFQLAAPLRSRQLIRRAMWKEILAGNGVLLALALLTPVWIRLSGNFVSLFRKAHGSLTAIAAQISVEEFVRFDATTLWFYAGCLAIFIVTSAADLNGSSTGVYRDYMQRGGKEDRWLGSARRVRSDEWSYETPAILNQALRTDRFATFATEIGGHNVSLIGDLPVKHPSTFFRPQFWPFFVLPVDYAFAVFWQFKAFVLLTGVFTWLLLVTESSTWAIFGSLWYFFSPMMQWDYSWASGLPEMVGLIAWTTALACFIAVGRNLVALTLAATGMTICAIDFALCAYIPHMIPLVWIMLLFFAGWCLVKRAAIFRVDCRKRRLLISGAAILVIGIVGAFVYHDVRDAIAGIAGTHYPGSRTYPSASAPVYLLASHFFLWTETEAHFPPSLANISEASGILWLAPVTLLCFARRNFSRNQRFAFIAVWAGFLLLFCWITLPVPAAVGKWLALDKTAGTRVFPALGAANVAIVALSMAAARSKAVSNGGDSGWLGIALRSVGTFVVWLTLMLLTNQSLSSYFSWPEIFLATFAATLLTMLILERRARLFMAAMIGSGALLFGAVNPVTRGLPVILDSELFRFVHSEPKLLEGKWIVFSDNYADSGYLNATGCDVYTGLHYLPDIDHFKLFGSRGWDLRLLNNDWFLMAVAIGPNEKGSLKNINGLGLLWNVHPGDPILKLLGIKYAAFAVKPDRSLETSGVLEPLADQAIDSFWLYELR